jgi:phosphatidylglycerol:prolipoprotein diacylglycerol transferase
LAKKEGRAQEQDSRENFHNSTVSRLGNWTSGENSVNVAVLIPYYPEPVLEIFGLRFQAFGALVACALLSGSWIFMRRVRKQGLDAQFAKLFIVAVASIGYFASYALKAIFFNTPGIYSFAGLVGGLLTAAWLMHRYRITAADRWRYLDNLAFAFTCGWIFGRAGCSLAHDHVGIPSNSILAVRFPGGPRYDLGLLELIFTVLLALVFFFLDRRRRPPGLFLGLFFLTYGIFRVWRDRLEAGHAAAPSADGLFAIACLVAGGWILSVIVMHRSRSTEKLARSHKH